MILFTFPARAWSAGEVEVNSSVDRSEITVGDVIHYEIRVEYPAEGRVELPSLLGNLGSFEVKDYQVSDAKPTGNRVTQTWSLRLSTFTVGKYMIPPQEVIFQPQDSVGGSRHGDSSGSAGAIDTTAHGKNGAAYMTQPIEINVARTSPETVKDIADIAALAVVVEGQPWLLYGLIAAGLCGLAGFFWFRSRRKSETASEKPMLPPFEEAMEKLAALKSVSFASQNRYKEFGFLLSELLRRYISRRFNVEALESTASEFLELLNDLPITSAQKDWLAGFSEASDLVKFAEAPLTEKQAQEWLTGTENFLRQTRPQENVPTAGKEPAR